ncbi:MAG: hypothetical protein QQN63_00570 [Nitrosopumilus sp.]
MLIVVVHGHSQTYHQPKGLDILIKDLKELDLHVHEYIWNGDLEQAAYNLRQEIYNHELIGIAYSWGNPWLRWLSDDFNIPFVQMHHVAPVNRQKGFPYSIRQWKALFRLGKFKAARNVRKVYAYRQINDRPAEKHVIGTNLPDLQLVMGTAKRLEKLSKKLIIEPFVDVDARHSNMDDNRVIHSRILNRIKDSLILKNSDKV